MFLMVTFSRPRFSRWWRGFWMNVVMAGHHVSMAFFSRAVSGMSAQVTHWSNRARSRAASAIVVQTSSRRSCSFTPQAAAISSVGSSTLRTVFSSSRPRGERVS